MGAGDAEPLYKLVFHHRLRRTEGIEQQSVEVAGLSKKKSEQTAR